ncbi:MAG TPA: hypothetical protein VJZ27_17110, partial [Aggregatilineales bacterium]|nr:hypothetical protein [Aggregatilineales bacterium]
TLDGVQAGDVVTFRYTGNLGTLSEIGALSLDGTPMQTKIARFEERNNQYVLVETITGQGPYRAIVKTDGSYALEVIAGDDLTDNRGTLRINETLNQTVVNENPVLVSYDLDVAGDSDLAIVLSGRAGTPFVRDASDNRVEALEGVDTNGFDLTRFHFIPGTYTIYMQVIGSYTISVTPVFGDLTDSLGNFKGSVLLENAIESTDDDEDKFPISVYNLSSGTGKPLVDGELVTLFLERATDVSDDSISIQSADGLISVVQSSNALPRQLLYIGVHELRGIAPYRVIVNGLEAYRVNITRGDKLSNDKGSIVVGHSVSDSSASPELLTYEIAPELGKRLVEGDTVTLGFRNRGDEDDPFTIPTITDGKENPVGPGQTFSVGRLYLGVYELQGAAPYRIFIPNLGAYTLDVNIGDTLVNDQGELELAADDPITGTTDGPQIVEYALKIEQERTFTISISDTNRDGFQGFELNSQLRKVENDEFVPDNISLSTGQTIKRVYTLQPGDYILSFTVEGTYSIESEDGDDLTVDKGVFYLGDA